MASRTSPRQLPLEPREARRGVAALLTSTRWPGDVDATLLAVQEALINAARHGAGLRDVTAVLDGEILVVEVADRGQVGAPPARASAPAPLAESGRGLWLMHEIARDVTITTEPEGRGCG